MDPFEPIHVCVPGDPRDPRCRVDAPNGVVVHYVPELHPDDLDVVGGIPCTSVARTLIDCAECMTRDELRGCFERAREMGILDWDKLQASRERVEWRPSLVMFDALVAEFR